MSITADAWLATKAETVTARTLALYAHIISAYQRWASDNRHTADLPLTPVVRLYRDWLRDEGRAPSTIRGVITVLAAWAADAGQPIDVRLPEQQPRAPRWLTPQELARMLARVESMMSAHPPLMSIHAGSAIKLMAYTGLRVSEACAVTAADVTLRERSGDLLVRGKGDKTRVVPLSHDARELLRLWCSLPPRFTATYTLFNIRPRAVQEAMRLLAAVCELPGLTPHTLRHTFAHGLVAKGTPLPTVAGILGHSSITTTQIYSTASLAEMQAAVDQIGE